MILAPQSNLPQFIVKNGEVLVRKSYEIVLVNGKPVMRDLPFNNEYLNEIQKRKWFADNKKALEAGK